MNTSTKNYNHQKIELKWQNRWAKDKLYKVDLTTKKPKWFALTMFPYPSGDLHIGHWFAFVPADTHARFKRMEGFNVLHPQGFDAFGLPAENAAIERNINPKTWTYENISNMRRQFNIMANSYDWDNSLITCDPEYYKWNQFFFLKMFKEKLAYRKNGPVWWDPIDKTTLANEQIKDGKSERSGGEVIRKMMPQWYLKITDYAEELLLMDNLEWPEKIKIMQRNWIGKSEGCLVKFQTTLTNDSDKFIETFTTRIDTLFGVSFLVLAPEHTLIKKLVASKSSKTVYKYISDALKTTDIERTSTEKKTTGVFTGSFCKNPLSNEKIPIFIADYVLGTYGTGAVMGVPAHDQRDYEFAKKYDLPIKMVIKDKNSKKETLNQAYTEDGILIHSAEFNNLDNNIAKTKITEKLTKIKLGTQHTTYHLRDWLISRQRYWGTPIPIFYSENEEILPVPENELPVLLPNAKKFMPTGRSPLTFNKKFLEVNHPKYGKVRRETDTMDTFVDSSWYHLRFVPGYTNKTPFNSKQIEEWLPVDQYMGGAEHAVMHLLYSRFFNKVLRDLGFVKFDEPYKRLFNQGIMLARHMKISKRNNPLNPEPLVKKYGTDTIRCYLMFLGPWHKGGDWSDSGINGISRWLNRIWYLATLEISSKQNTTSSIDEIKELEVKINATIKKIREDSKVFKFNTAIASLMELTNSLYALNEKIHAIGSLWKKSIKKLLLLLAPFAPHLAEELWEINNYKYSIHKEKLPDYDEEMLETDTITIIIQINGKLRDQITLKKGCSQKEVENIVLTRKKIKSYIGNNSLKRIIFIQDRLINLVV